MKISPNISLISTTMAVGVSTAVLTTITGYGTTLFQIVVLGAWGIIGDLTSSTFADQNHWAVWDVAFGINVLLFLIPSGIVWLLGRKRWPIICAGIVIGWCLFYLASLFFLFPATDSP